MYPPIGTFSQIAHPYKLFASRYIKDEDNCFISQFGMYLLLAFTYRCVACENPPLIPYSNINSISLSVGNSNFILAILKHASRANPGVV